MVIPDVLFTPEYEAVKITGVELLTLPASPRTSLKLNLAGLSPWLARWRP
jgi:hypothetical protein